MISSRDIKFKLWRARENGGLRWPTNIRRSEVDPIKGFLSEFNVIFVRLRYSTSSRQFGEAYYQECHGKSQYFRTVMLEFYGVFSLFIAENSLITAWFTIRKIEKK